MADNPQEDINKSKKPTKEDVLGEIRETAPMIPWSEISSKLLTELSKGYVQPPDIATLKDPELYDKCLKDSIVAKAINQRLALTASSKWHLVSADGGNFATKIYKSIMEQIPEFTKARTHLASSCFHGLTGLRITSLYPQINIKGMGIQEVWAPRLHQLDYGNIRIANDDNYSGNYKPYYSVFDFKAKEFLKAEPERNYIFLSHNDDVRRMGYGRPLLDAIYSDLYAMQTIQKLLLQGVERFALPHIIAMLNPEIFAGVNAQGDNFKDVDEMVDAIVTAIAQLKRGGVMVLPDGTKIEKIEVAASAIAPLQNLMQMYEGRITRLVLGADLPTGGGPDETGSYARAKVEQESTDSLIGLDRQNLEEKLQELLETIKYHNKQLFANIIDPKSRIPLSNLPVPKFKLGEAYNDDKDSALERFSLAMNAGLPLRKKEVYEVLGFTEPSDDDDEEIFYPGMQQQQQLPPEELPQEQGIV